MPAPIKETEINWHDPVRVRFGFTGLNSEHAVPIIRRLIQSEWPEVRRYKQCVYIIRLQGTVAVSYKTEHSPVIYIGEGNAFYRLYTHAYWISSLLISIPNTQIEIYIAEIARKNQKNLYKYIEADMIRWFVDEFGMLPWFNRQRISIRIRPRS